MMGVEARYAALIEQFGARPGVSVPQRKGFGSGTLCVNDRIFAMLTRDHLVVKLPARRVSELIAGGQGSTFDAGKGKPMREWLSVADDADWTALAEEALSFVGSRP